MENNFERKEKVAVDVEFMVRGDWVKYVIKYDDSSVSEEMDAGFPIIKSPDSLKKAMKKKRKEILGEMSV